MARFIIEPHFRLQEWVAEEKGYFKAQGLDYEFRELVQSTDGKIHDKGDKVGAYQSFEKGRAAGTRCKRCRCRNEMLRQSARQGDTREHGIRRADRRKQRGAHRIGVSDVQQLPVLVGHTAQRECPRFMMGGAEAVSILGEHFMGAVRQGCGDLQRGLIHGVP